MKIRNGPYCLLWCQSLGFAGLVAFAWMEKSEKLPLWLYREHLAQWPKSTLFTAVITLVWAVVCLLTYRVAAHLRYLERHLSRREEAARRQAEGTEDLPKANASNALPRACSNQSQTKWSFAEVRRQNGGGTIGRDVNLTGAQPRRFSFPSIVGLF